MKQIETYGLSPLDVANWFTCSLDREAGDSITHLKLQKLLYYAQAWSLALNSVALFEDDFEAWAHGPALPAVYQEYKDYGFDTIPSCECENKMEGDVEEVLKEVNRVYGELSAKKLEYLTHNEKPWVEARNGIASEKSSNAIITKESMLHFYSKLLNEQEAEE